MASPARSPQVRLTVVLDTRVPLEALLITVLRRNPAARRQEWLRQVLLPGFRSDCLGLRQAMTHAPARLSEPPHIAPVSSPDPAAPRAATEEFCVPLTAGPPNGKPLAGLRTLIG